MLFYGVTQNITVSAKMFPPSSPTTSTTVEEESFSPVFSRGISSRTLPPLPPPRPLRSLYSRRRRPELRSRSSCRGVILRRAPGRSTLQLTRKRGFQNLGDSLVALFAHERLKKQKRVIKQEKPRYCSPPWESKSPQI